VGVAQRCLCACVVGDHSGDVIEVQAELTVCEDGSKLLYVRVPVQPIACLCSPDGGSRLISS
jgi:hypothetical protein